MPITCLFERRVRFMRFAGFVLVAFIILTCNCTADSSIPSDSIVRNFRYILTVSNSQNETSFGGQLYSFGPAQKSARQFKTEPRASEKWKTTENVDGSEIYQFDLGNIPPLGKKVITVSCKVHLSKSPLKANLDDHSESKYLLSEEYIECDSPELIKIAGKLQGKSADATVKAIYKWVTNYLKKSNYTAPVKGALSAFKSQKGDCTEYACLIAALCRASKIPARVVGGFVLQRNTVLTPNLYHDWTEVMVDGFWRVVDGHGRSIMEDEEKYIVFRYLGSKGPINDLNRYKITGEGLTVKMDSRSLKSRTKDQPCNCR
jgi:transglutaminase/protease-like cytokinesis protein 3